MVIASGAVASTLRMGLQVLSNHRSPQLEIYPHLRNTLGPAEEIKYGGFKGQVASHVVRHQEIVIEFTLANVGGDRAENVRLVLAGDYEYRHGLSRLSKIPVLSGRTIPQLAPAQAIHLFRFDDTDLLDYGTDGKPTGMRTDGFSIAIEYDGPARGANRFRRIATRIGRRAQFVTHFRFDPQIYESVDLPTPEVLG